MHSEVIPVHDFTLPDLAGIPAITQDEVYRLLAGKVRRGRQIGDILFTLGLAGMAISLGFYKNTPWAVASGLIGVVAGFIYYRARQKLDLLRAIVEEPSLVYWAHPTTLRQKVVGQAMETNFITLHSRRGSSFEVALPYGQMLSVMAWFKQQNTEIRLGAYDSTP